MDWLAPPWLSALSSEKWKSHPTTAPHIYHMYNVYNSRSDWLKC